MKRIATTCITALAICLAFALAGCAQTPSPSDVTKEALDALKAQDYESLKQYYSGDTESLDIADMASSLSGTDLSSASESEQVVVQKLLETITDFDYVIGEETIDGDTASVDVSITSRDLGSALNEAIGEFFTVALQAAFSGADESEIESQFVEIFNSKVDSASRDHVQDTSFTLTKTDGEWVMDPVTEDNMDAIMGGMVSGAQELSNSLEGLSGEDFSFDPSVDDGSDELEEELEDAA